MTTECRYCDGLGEIEVSRDCTPSEDTGGMSELHGTAPCEHCHGSGRGAATQGAEPRIAWPTKRMKDER